MADLFGQRDFTVRFDWGPVGAEAMAADVAVVVDVLSFSTSVTIAVERGMRVFPYPWRGPRAEAFAAEHGAVLAMGRLEASRSPDLLAPSLSPVALQMCRFVPRVVLPSPNGSSIAELLRAGGSIVAAGCLRNAHAIAEWLAPTINAGRSVGVVAAGERWGGDDSLRPALEDHLGAGAILSELVELGFGDRMSPEAAAAAQLFDAASERLADRLHQCVGGRELIEAGFGTDVDVAAELNVSGSVPVLIDGAFRRAR
ncbi:2-phosphosulfolactate phosphatase [Microlunatus sp. Gsoil 973]|jgi:2-phosphosulfolactate phosphatase|uniref:2-phosphosulfolactate phosphatase n=1 Tax=Microlunatus sp. Gsoil 973 TaxID=2672569 RepID=UPI0012B472F5|nr:2-phosphosulfolactate phosphatase [Microlunatus sp. Gsoil 973]QGN33236.1 2-phosphosulfolactate phosphatase [Microlunatus sp. Gsoil 973]